MGGGPSIPKSVTLILARELATNVSTPMLLLDRQGTLVFWNEPANVVFGAPFHEVGELPATDWDGRWPVADEHGEPISLLSTKLSNVILNRTPGHQTIKVTGLDGIQRKLEATAFPLFDNRNDFIGALAVFWQVTNGHGPAGADAQPYRPPT